jgi:hypothetical protein
VPSKVSFFNLNVGTAARDAVWSLPQQGCWLFFGVRSSLGLFQAWFNPIGNFGYYDGSGTVRNPGKLFDLSVSIINLEEASVRAVLAFVLSLKA